MAAARLTRTRLAFALLFALALTSWPVAGVADPASDYKRAVEASFKQWLEGLWPEAEAAGISRATFDKQLKGLKLDWSLPQLTPPDPAYPGGPALPDSMKPKPKPQAEFGVPQNYFKASSLNALAGSGRAKYRQLAPTLKAIEEQYGVPASIVLAIWGRETGFGRAALPYDAVTAIATQAFMGRRADEFRPQLIGALQIIELGHATRQMMKSSWAGAMGHVQFLPGDFEEHAVDFDGDGRRDIWRSVPDALASAGNALRSQGWDGNQPWAYEVTLPKNFDCTLQGPDQSLPIKEWIDLGVRRVNGREFPQDRLGDWTFLVLPAGMKGPAFLATTNFSVLKLYNNSDVYAIFVGHVADMIAYNTPVQFVGTWQPVERFTRDRVLKFQEVLVSQGHDVGKVDGLVGFKTRQTIGKEEKARGLPLTCYPSHALINQVLK
ncbi:lytic murein transglycosylase [Methyloceanibacter stevinii]|uniref:lytic murein transglycosylase n=1 Tax=Methyloceanibacter stevinii TaxID=1774970 RepID=UPI000849AB30|nr:lytic murein transglycosylase [Methyloceanibacter stevinii]